MTTYVCVDLETTGLAPDKTEIIEIAGVKIKDGQVDSTFSSLVKPTQSVSPFISKLTHIYPEMLEDAPEFSEIAQDFVDFVGDGIFVAHNVKFDFDVVNYSLQRLGQKPLQCGSLDSQEVAVILFPNAVSHKLAGLAAHCGLTNVQRHRAFPDAMTLAKIWLKMCRFRDTLPPVLVREVLRMLGPEKSDLKGFFEPVLDQAGLPDSMDYLKVIQQSVDLSYETTPSQAVIEDEADLINLLEEESDFQTHFEWFEYRPGQADMLRKILEALKSSQHAVIEAPTGIGKSLAYMIAAIFWSTKTGKPVVLSTKTKQLQTQLLAEIRAGMVGAYLPPCAVSVVKGKDNYVDVQRFDDLYQSYVTGGSTNEIVEFLGILSWLLQTRTGDLTELHSNLYNRFSGRIQFVQFSQHSPARFRNACFVHRLRQQAKKTNLIITNHALLLADRQSKSGILPTPAALIIDEAHALESVATQAMECQLKSRQITDIINRIDDRKGGGIVGELLLLSKRLSGTAEVPAVLDEVAGILGTHAGRLFKIKKKISEKLRGLTSHPDCQKTDVDREQRIITESAWESDDWQNLCRHGQDLTTLLVASLAEINRAKEVVGDIVDRDAIRSLHTLQALGNLVEAVIQASQKIFVYDPHWVYWLDVAVRKKPRITIFAAPIMVGDQLSKTIFKKVPSVVCTSASLSMNGDVQFFKSRVGLADSLDLVIPSPFYFKEQAIIGLLKPEAQNPQPSLNDLLIQLLASFRGRTMVLFTSHRQLRSTYYRVRETLEEQGITILCQDIHGNREAIIQQYRQHFETAVIFGVDSFWEGVDFAGRLLECVIMPKLPFAVPTDPLVQARSNQEKQAERDGFRHFVLPMAVLKFKQGVGRLIRSMSDRGVVFVLDDRILTRPYGRNFLKEVSDYYQVSGSVDSLIKHAQAWMKLPDQNGRMAVR